MMAATSFVDVAALMSVQEIAARVWAPRLPLPPRPRAASASSLVLWLGSEAAGPSRSLALPLRATAHLFLGCEASVQAPSALLTARVSLSRATAHPLPLLLLLARRRLFLLSLSSEASVPEPLSRDGAFSSSSRDGVSIHVAPRTRDQRIGSCGDLSLSLSSHLRGPAPEALPCATAPPPRPLHATAYLSPAARPQVRRLWPSCWHESRFLRTVSQSHFNSPLPGLFSLSFSFGLLGLSFVLPPPPLPPPLCLSLLWARFSARPILRLSLRSSQSGRALGFLPPGTRIARSADIGRGMITQASSPAYSISYPQIPLSESPKA